MEDSLPGVSPAKPQDKSVLIVDDDDDQRDLLKHVVGKAGFQVLEACDAMEAIRKAQDLSPDGILLDLMLPGMGGYEIARELQALGAGSIPIFIVTARSLDAKTIHNLREEPNIKDFFLKPPSPTLLVARLHAQLGTSPARI